MKTRERIYHNLQMETDDNYRQEYVLDAMYRTFCYVDEVDYTSVRGAYLIAIQDMKRIIGPSGKHFAYVYVEAVNQYINQRFSESDIKHIKSSLMYNSFLQHAKDAATQ